VTRAQSYVENAVECPQLLIEPDPHCPECVAIMVWRSAHRSIVIPDGTEIKLSAAPWGDRHLHMRSVRVAHLKKRLTQHPENYETKERWHPVA
jgi:hypothetical protein